MTDTPQKPGWRSVLLGLFVAGQLVYLLLSNLIQLVPRELPPPRGELDIRVQREGTATDVRSIQDAINGLGTAIDRYGELTGQVQAWSLFAPGFGTQSLVPVVECYCSEGSGLKQITLSPKTLPDDPEHYFRFPSSYSRLAAYEYLLAVIYLNYSAESLAQRGPEWRAAILDRVRNQQKSLEAYFRWNLRMFQLRYPDRPRPQEMILAVKIIPSPKPGEAARPPAFTVPLARWQPGREPEPGFLPVQAYDPTTQEFVPLPVEGDAP
jgi:hypothetical protein